jgi:hypothetical protein
MSESGIDAERGRRLDPADMINKWSGDLRRGIGDRGTGDLTGAQVIEAAARHR